MIKTINIEVLKDSPQIKIKDKILVVVILTLEITKLKIFRGKNISTIERVVYPVINNDNIIWCDEEGININSCTDDLERYTDDQGRTHSFGIETSDRIINYLGVQQFKGLLK
jgi:hypothetical protein